MIKEQELKNKCTPKFIKWMCEYAEGFEFLNIGNWAGYRFELHKPRDNDPNVYFPLLVHRAVEGWNKLKHEEIFMEIVVYKDKVCLENYKLETHNNVEDYYKYILIDKNFKNYQPQSLTHAECAMLDCLLDVFGTGGER